jgi:hypothetical protein
MDQLIKFFDDFKRLFYLSIIFTSWALSADIASKYILNKSINVVYENINIKDWLIISMLHIATIFTAIVIYNVIKYIQLLFPNFITSYDNDIYYYSYGELLNEAVLTDNQTMYNYYNKHKSEVKSKLNMRYVCLSILLLIVLDSINKDSVVSTLLKKFNDLSFLQRAPISVLILFHMLGLLIILFGKSSLEYTYIKKKNFHNNIKKNNE